MMKRNSEKLPVSILDLATILEGKTPTETFSNSLLLAQKAEDWGYQRFWLAEHHNMESIASSATSILIGFIAGGTKTIRVGSGGIMLPNHAPLIVAEQFGTLATLYPGRIDLGLGRAPGTDPVTSMALRRDRMGASIDFPDNVRELQTYLSAENKTGRVRAIPGEGLDIPVWILGSSTDSARLAASNGLPYAFATHFAPTYFREAIQIYRRDFRPSEKLKAPYVMACVNVIVADTTEEAEKLATSFFQLGAGIVRGKTKPLPPPVDSMHGVWNEYEEAVVRNMMTYSFIGNPMEVQQELQDFIDSSEVNELMIVSHIYDIGAKLKSYEWVAEVAARLRVVKGEG